MTHPDPTRLEELGAAVAIGELTIPIAKRFPLSEARAAQELAEIGRRREGLLIPTAGLDAKGGDLGSSWRDGTKRFDVH
jgi:hypothetical protein